MGEGAHSVVSQFLGEAVISTGETCQASRRSAAKAQKLERSLRKWDEHREGGKSAQNAQAPSADLALKATFSKTTNQF